MMKIFRAQAVERHEKKGMRQGYRKERSKGMGMGK